MAYALSVCPEGEARRYFCAVSQVLFPELQHSYPLHRAARPTQTLEISLKLILLWDWVLQNSIWKHKKPVFKSKFSLFWCPSFFFPLIMFGIILNPGHQRPWVVTKGWRQRWDAETGEEVTVSGRRQRQDAGGGPFKRIFPAVRDLQRVEFVVE